MNAMHSMKILAIIGAAAALASCTSLPSSAELDQQAANDLEHDLPILDDQHLEIFACSHAVPRFWNRLPPRSGSGPKSFHAPDSPTGVTKSYVL